MINIDLNTIPIKDIINHHTNYVKNVINKRYKNLSNSFSKRDKEFFKEYLGDDDKAICRKLIYICISGNLEGIINDFEYKYQSTYKKKFSDEIRRKRKSKTRKENQIVKLLNSILNYKAFNEGIAPSMTFPDGWNRHIFIHSLNIKVCPYCNRNYVTIYRDTDGADKTTADADHYYPKSLYPILQINIFNMIPSCSVCNSKMKNDNDKRHLYPYVDKSTSLTFSTPFNTLDELYNFREKDIKIDIIPEVGNNRAEASIEVFKLDKLYGIHNDVVFELKNKIRAYEAFEEDYYKKLLGNELYQNIFFNINLNLKEYWFDFLEKQSANEPLVKLKQDIYNQIKLL